jgi:leader peptidase (prepilin peptidase)/N-methyltransferase
LSDENPSLPSEPSPTCDGSEQIDAPKLPRARKRPKKRFVWRRYGPVLALIGALVLGWFLYAVVWPPLEIRHKIATAQWKYSRSDPEINVPVRMIYRTCEYLYCFWFFYLGASIGSFINVVANRTPQGKTIVSRGSHCPFCDQPLSMLENTPIFGWVALRGRCRTCHLPIAVRYLLMEILVGGIFMILAIIELMGNGMNLPHRDWRFGAGIVSTVFYPKWNLIGACIVHASLFAVAVMLIASHMDRLRFPTLPLIMIGIIFLACATFNPIVAPVSWAEPWQPTYPQMSSAPWQRFQTSLVGTAAGLLVGVLFAILHWQTFFRDKDPTGAGPWFAHSIFIFTLAGTLLGWQAAVNVGILGACLSMIALNGSLLGNAAGLAKDPVLRPQVLALAIATITLLLHHLCWRQLAFLSLLPFQPGN